MVCVHEFAQRNSRRLERHTEKDAHHEAVKPFATANLLVSSTVLCEVDYMMTKYLGEYAARAFLGGQARGEWQLLPFDAVDLESANAIRDAHNNFMTAYSLSLIPNLEQLSWQQLSAQNLARAYSDSNLEPRMST
jgi:hypothetical protein